ncbi:hypothetical protein BGW38_009248 [Lunasporangiospora selenospora]|uniref:RRM domain-containing protein n=1 Tax=Lunasporangiospora selenospora TaxID=979761 RepID=A0A9P6FZH1_9FUNG|nr:hypothetical protein BGW38_009248 [Lunasporangiospora selenospora]
MSALLSFTKSAFAAIPRRSFGPNTIAIRTYATKKIFFGNIPWKTTDEELKEFLEPYGEIKDFYTPKDQYGNTRGFGFLEAEDEIADAIIKDASEVELNGRRMHFEISTRPAGAGRSRGEFRGRRDDNEGGDRQFRRRRDDSGNDQGDRQFRRRRDDSEGGDRQFRRRRDDFNNNDGDRQFRRRRDDNDESRDLARPRRDENDRE